MGGIADIEARVGSDVHIQNARRRKSKVHNEHIEIMSAEFTCKQFACQKQNESGVKVLEAIMNKQL